MPLPQTRNVEEVGDFDVDVNLSGQIILLLPEHEVRSKAELLVVVSKMDMREFLNGIYSLYCRFPRVAFARLDSSGDLLEHSFLNVVGILVRAEKARVVNAKVSLGDTGNGIIEGRARVLVSLVRLIFDGPVSSLAGFRVRYLRLVQQRLKVLKLFGYAIQLGYSHFAIYGSKTVEVTQDIHEVCLCRGELGACALFQNEASKRSLQLFKIPNLLLLFSLAFVWCRAWLAMLSRRVVIIAISIAFWVFESWS